MYINIHSPAMTSGTIRVRSAALWDDRSRTMLVVLWFLESHLARRIGGVTVLSWKQDTYIYIYIHVYVYVYIYIYVGVIILVEDFGDLDTASAIACTSLLWNAWKARLLWWHHLRLLAYQNTPLRFVKDMVVLAASLSQQPRQGLLQSEWISYPNVWPLGGWLLLGYLESWFNMIY